MTSMKALACALAVAFITVSPALSGQRVTVVADEWPPFSGENLPNRGMSLDVISTILRRAGYEVETQVLPWARIMDGARKGDHDIVGSLFADPEIETFMTYGKPFYQTEIHFVQGAGRDIAISDLDSLRPYSIAVGDGFLYEQNFDQADYLNKIVVTTALQGLQMVAYGRADLTLDSVDVLRYAIRADDPSISDRVEILPHVLTTHGIHMAVRNDLPGKDQLVAAFNRVLSEMQEDGSLAELLQKHTGP